MYVNEGGHFFNSPCSLKELFKEDIIQSIIPLVISNTDFLLVGFRSYTRITKWKRD